MDFSANKSNRPASKQILRSPYQVDMGRREVTAENGRSAVHIVNLTCTRLTSLSLDPLVFADWVATLTRAPVD